jgi:putative addiction module component (TIGR02574 family)
VSPECSGGCVCGRAGVNLLARRFIAIIGIATLGAKERLDLIEQLWESLLPTPEAVPFSGENRDEFDRRFDEPDREGPTGTPAKEVLNRLRQRNTAILQDLTPRRHLASDTSPLMTP